MRIINNFWHMRTNLKRSLSSLWQESTKYNDAYSLDLNIDPASQAAIQSASNIRGTTRPPALMIYGVAPRAGTNYIGNILSNHPAISAYPNNIYEVPFLCMTDKLQSFQDSFFGDYYRNIDQMNKNDFLPLFGAAFISHLYSFAPDNKIILTKEPDVRYLRYFPITFPHENLLLVLRDGRDVVHSTITTWPKMSFKKICQRWHDSAMLMLAFHKKYQQQYLLIKYEDMLDDPRKNMTNILQHYQLDIDAYPFDAIDSMPIVGSSTVSKVGDTVNWKPVESDGNFKPTNKWLTWTDKQKKVFKNIAGSSLIACGYCEDMDW